MKLKKKQIKINKRDINNNIFNENDNKEDIILFEFNSNNNENNNSNDSEIKKDNNYKLKEYLNNKIEKDNLNNIDINNKNMNSYDLFSLNSKLDSDVLINISNNNSETNKNNNLFLNIYKNNYIKYSNIIQNDYNILSIILNYYKDLEGFVQKNNLKNTNSYNYEPLEFKANLVFDHNKYVESEYNKLFKFIISNAINNISYYNISEETIKLELYPTKRINLENNNENYLLNIIELSTININDKDIYEKIRVNVFKYLKLKSKYDNSDISLCIKTGNLDYLFLINKANKFVLCNIILYIKTIDLCLLKTIIQTFILNYFKLEVSIFKLKYLIIYLIIFHKVIDKEYYKNILIKIISNNDIITNLFNKKLNYYFEILLYILTNKLNYNLDDILYKYYLLIINNYENIINIYKNKYIKSLYNFMNYHKECYLNKDFNKKLELLIKNYN